MLKVVALSFVALAIGYLVGLVGGLWLVTTFSSNTHDGSVEAVMTSAFVVGPITAVLALVGTLVFLRRRSPR